MKNIAVFSYNFTVEYATSVLKGIYRYFEENSDARVFFAQTKMPNTDAGFFDYQYWAAAEYLKSDFIDEVLVVSNSYFYYVSREKFLQTFSQFSNKKLVSVGMKIDKKNAFYVDTKCAASYDEVIWHLKNVHGCKRIAFFSGNNFGSVEAFERYDAFKNALKNNGLEFDESIIFHGNFTSSSAKKELNARIKDRFDVKFDALVCANDLTAVGCIDFFNEIGVHIPEELKIVGFDNTSHASLCNPALTTIDPSIEQQGYDAADLGMRILLGHTKEKCVYTPLRVIYRHSCGCANVLGMKNSESYKAVLSYYEDISHIDFLFDFVRGTSTLEEFSQAFQKISWYIGFSSITACMCEKPFAAKQGESFSIPYNVRLIMHLDSDKNICKVYDDSKSFNPSETLIPPELEAANLISTGQFIMQPIFLGELQYGYIICRLKQTNFAVNSIVLKLFTSMLAQAYDYTKTIRHAHGLNESNIELTNYNMALRIKSTTDELTSVLNRRGFFDNGQKVLALASEMDMSGLVFFADLDGLKKINDTYGHEYGDRAIRLQAKILKEAFRQTDTVGRLSGDEFGVISLGMKKEYVEKMRKKVEDLNIYYSEEEKLPFVLSISLGFAEFTPAKCTLEKLLKVADANLYEQKKIHHAKQSDL